MNKARQPPPGVMPKGRAPSTSSLDAISPVQVFLDRRHLSRCRGRRTRFKKTKKNNLGLTFTVLSPKLSLRSCRWTRCRAWLLSTWGALPRLTLRACKVFQPHWVPLSVIPSPQPRLSRHSLTLIPAHHLEALAACHRSSLVWTLVLCYFLIPSFKMREQGMFWGKTGDGVPLHFHHTLCLELGMHRVVKIYIWGLLNVKFKSVGPE